MSSEKIDFKKAAHYKAKRDTPEVIEVPEQRYLMIDGCGDPNSDSFALALAALYPLAYRTKFVSKSQLGRDYVVPPLEALWWADDMDSFTAARDKSQWHWTAMIMTPEWITADLVKQVERDLRSSGAPERHDDVRFESLNEGTCVQALHVGAFDDEGPLLERMHKDFIPSEGLRMTGRHHEIYLSDPRRTAPQGLRTILRQPVTVLTS